MEKRNSHIIWEDKNYIAAHKPSGLMIHRSKEAWHIKDNLLAQIRDLSNTYLYPINRLDRPVSGIVLFAKDKEAASLIKDRWHDESTKKFYIALVKGNIENEGTFNFKLSDENKVRKPAVTHYAPILNYPQNTLVRINIETGRRHQIRRHFSRRMHQVLGDTTHGKGIINQYFRDHYDLQRIFLHSYKLEFIQPITSAKISIIDPLPIELQNVLDKFSNPPV